MKKLLYALLLVLNGSLAEAQPYNITAYIDSTVITPTDSSSLQSITYSGQGMKWVFDRRVDDWVFINAYLFDVIYDDDLTAQVQVNPEFGSVVAAAAEAQKYAFVIGQLPACLRIAVTKICVHLGAESFGGGFNSVIIHTGQSATYEALGILEEVLFHESTHTALDPVHALEPGWVNAQNADSGFISTYGASSPTVEDLAESFLTWFMARQCSRRISAADSVIIAQTIPNRLNYFDNQHFEVYPRCVDAALLGTFAEEEPITYSAYPNPTDRLITLELQPFLSSPTYVMKDVMGRQVMTGVIDAATATIDVSVLPDGVYQLQIGQKPELTVKILKY